MFDRTGGQILARYVLANPHEVAGRSVRDFGSGLRLVAIAAAKAGAAKVLANDANHLKDREVRKTSVYRLLV